MNMYKYSEPVMQSRLNIDVSDRRERLDHLDFRDDDIEFAAILQKQVISPNVEKIVEKFYEFLLSQREISQFFSEPVTIENLKRTQTLHLLSLGVDYDSAEYFEARLQVGLRHAEIKLPLGLYQCACSKLQQCIIDAFPEDIFKDRTTLMSLLNFVTKIISLDMSLAIDAYYHEGLNGLRESVTMLRHRGRYLSKQLNQDHLTEVASRRYAYEFLQQLLDRMKDDELDLYVLMCDVDHFKSVNDEHGHLIGDQVLVEVAARIRCTIRDVDLVARYGGEEFMVILPETDQANALLISERIRLCICSSPIHIQDVIIPLSISLGMARAECGDAIEVLVSRADQSLYQAKQLGRNRVQMYQ